MSHAHLGISHIHIDSDGVGEDPRSSNSAEGHDALAGSGLGSHIIAVGCTRSGRDADNVSVGGLQVACCQGCCRLNADSEGFLQCHRMTSV